MALNLSTLIPTRKVQAAGLTGIAVWALGAALHKWAHLDIPQEVLSGIITPIAVGVAYLVPPAERDVIAKVDTAIKADAVAPTLDHSALVQAIADAATSGVARLPAGTFTLAAPVILQAVRTSVQQAITQSGFQQTDATAQQAFSNLYRDTAAQQQAPQPTLNPAVFGAGTPQPA